MMEAYVTVLTKGICQSDENGSFLIKDHDVRKAYLAGSVKGKTSQSNQYIPPSHTTDIDNGL